MADVIVGELVSIHETQQIAKIVEVTGGVAVAATDWVDLPGGGFIYSEDNLVPVFTSELNL